MNTLPTDFSISVVVPAHNEKKQIANLLRGLLHQTVLPHEVIVVDNRSSDRTRKIALSFIPKFRKKRIIYRVLSERRIGAAFARNKGFYAAASPVIASTDADTVPHRNWIERIRKHFLKNDSVAVSGITIMHDAPPMVMLISQLHWYKYLTLALRMIFGFQTITTANAGVRSDMFRAVAGFNTHYRLPDQLEDTELSSRLSKLGIIRIDTSIKVDGFFRRYQPLSKAVSSSIRRLQSWMAIAKMRKRGV